MTVVALLFGSIFMRNTKGLSRNCTVNMFRDLGFTQSAVIGGGWVKSQKYAWLF